MGARRLLITGGSGFFGTNAVEYFRSRADTILNLDLVPPQIPEHAAFWRVADIRDRQALGREVADFAPTHILHLAARTGMGHHSAEFFAANTDGVANLIEVARSLTCVERIIFASSLLVCRYGSVPKSDDEYSPTNSYAESKVTGEKIVRSAGEVPFSWVIVRPSSMWGPWFDPHFRQFFKLVDRGIYFHPGNAEICKPICFAGNGLYMLDGLMKADASQVQGRTFYLVDYPKRSVRSWAIAIQRTTGARRIATIPLPLLRLVAKLGDIAKTFGWREPFLTSTRLANLTTGSDYPYQPIEAIVGPLPFDLETGVKQTVDWLVRQGDIRANRGSSTPKA